MRIVHLAIADDWEAAKQLGEYMVSTRGMSVDDVGYVHASAASQLRRVAEYGYSDVHSPLLVLVIDVDELHARGIDVRWEAETSEAETSAHIYAPLPTDEDAVVAELPAHFEGREFVPPELGDYDVIESPPEPG